MKIKINAYRIDEHILENIWVNINFIFKQNHFLLTVIQGITILDDDVLFPKEATTSIALSSDAVYRVL